VEDWQDPPQTAHGPWRQHAPAAPHRLTAQLTQLTQLAAGGLLVASNSQGFISALAIEAVMA